MSSNAMLGSVVALVVIVHSEGKGAVTRHEITYVMDEHEILTHRRVRMTRQLGLTWVPMKNTKKPLRLFTKWQ